MTTTQSQDERDFMSDSELRERLVDIAGGKNIFLAANSEVKFQDLGIRINSLLKESKAAGAREALEQDMTKAMLEGAIKVLESQNKTIATHIDSHGKADGWDAALKMVAESNQKEIASYREVLSNLEKKQ